MSASNDDTAEPNALWRTPNYGSWFGADTSTILAASIRDFVFPILVLAVTHSPAQAAFVGSVGIVAGAVAQLPGGVIQDRYDRRSIVLIASLVGVVLWAAGAILVFTGYFDFWIAAILSALLGIRGGLAGNTTNLMLRTLIPPRLLPKAVAVNTGRDAVIEFGGAPVGGLLLDLGRAIPFVTNTVLSSISVFFAHKLPTMSPARQGEELPTLRDIFSGLNFVIRTQLVRVPVLYGNILMAAFNGAILVSVMDLVSRGEPASLSALVNSGVAVGVLIGALGAGWIVLRVRGGILVVLAYALPVVSVSALIGTSTVTMRVAVMVPALLLLAPGGAVMGAVQMLAVPPTLLGRAFAAISLLEMAAGACVMALAGASLEHWGYVPTMRWLAGTMATMLVFICATRVIRSIPDPDHYEEFLAGEGLAVNARPDSTD